MLFYTPIKIEPIPTADPTDDELQLNERAQAPNAKLAEKNAKFQALPADKKRVAIAKNVLKWLALGKIIPKNGVYIEAENQMHASDRLNGDRCQACALGAMFACAVERRGGGAAKFWDPSGNESLYPYLEPYFDVEQLKLIESAFECNNKWGGYTSAAKRAAAFGEEIAPKHYLAYNATPQQERDARKSDRKRMEAIMRNIIKNKGTFIP